MQSYKASLEYLSSFVNYEKTGLEEAKNNFDLNPLRKTLEKLGNPQEAYKSIHVAGTKGKGSISTFTSSILQNAGFKVGLYTSPHLSTERERIRINGSMIPEEDLASTLDKLKEVIGPKEEKRFSFFEVYTLLAILYFSIKNVDYAVFEAGLGGRLDATNIIDAEVCVIAPVSYDHMHVLGGTLKEIAQEKAAIIKKGSFCVSAPQKKEVLEVIRLKCQEAGARLAIVGEEITYEVSLASEKGTQFDVTTEKTSYPECFTVMPGIFQAQNGSVAVGACEKMLGEVSQEAVKEGIKKAFIPGRMEILSHNPRILVDGAQNGASAKELKYSVEQIFKYDKLILLLGLSRDKDIKSVCDCLAPAASEIILTKSTSARAADPELIRGYIKKGSVKITRSVKEALGLAFKKAKKGDLILATGSFYLIGEVKDLLKKNAYT